LRATCNFVHAALAGLASAVQPTQSKTGMLE